MLFIYPPAFWISLVKLSMPEEDNLPVKLKYKITRPVIKKTSEAIKLLKIILPKTGFRKAVNLLTLPSKNIDIKSKGVTMPKTYMAPTKAG